MAKFYGVIGFAESTNNTPGVWTDHITERVYSGDLIRSTRRFESSETLNDDMNISNDVSILADPFAQQNFHAIKYVKFMGADGKMQDVKWKITSVDIQPPRLILVVGGLYNG